LHSGSHQAQEDASGDLTSAEGEKYFIYTNIMDQVIVF